MDRRGIAEVVGCRWLAATHTSRRGWCSSEGYFDSAWFCTGHLFGIAAAALQASTKHAAAVATEAPALTDDNYEQNGRSTAGDGGSPPDDTPSTDDTR
ncbi:hypothetical protein C8039_14805 [Halogeometricum sp. wsp3]|nr:hypothetical protein C8039_14805 [Halogeometricum sp. wsp3]